MDGYRRCNIQVALRFDQDEEQLSDVVTAAAIVEGGICDALTKFCDGTIIVDDISVRYSREVFLYEDELSECA